MAIPSGFQRGCGSSHRCRTWQTLPCCVLLTQYLPENDPSEGAGMDATLAAQRTTIRDAVSEVTTEVLAESLATARAVSATAAQWLTERVHLGEPAFSAE